MADNARPQTNVPLPSGLIAAFGDASTAVKAARREVKELTREINAAVRRGETVGPQVVKRLEQAQSLEKSLTESIKRQKLLQQGIATTRADATALKWLIGAQAFRTMMERGVPDLRSIGMMAFSSSEVLQQLAARHFGANAAITNFARGFGRVAPFVGEAVQSVFEGIDKHKADKGDLRKLAVDFESGKYSEAERERLNKIIEKEQRVFGGDPKKLFEEFIKLSENLATSDEKRWQRAVEPAIKREIQNLQEARFMGAKWWEIGGPPNWKDVLKDEIPKLEQLLGPALQARMDTAVEEKARELGYDQIGMQFTPQQEAFIRRQVVEKTLETIKDPQRKELLQLIEKNLLSLDAKQNALFKNAAQLQREASDKYRETEENRLNALRFQRARQRVALNGRIGE